MIRPGDLESDIPGLSFRRLTVEDAPAYFATVDANRDHLSQYGDITSLKYPTLASVRDSLERPQPNKVRLGMWAGDEFAGSVNLTDHHDGEAEIGYWVAEAHTGKGYATEAARAMTDFALRHYDSVMATAHTDNEPSKAVLRRAGYEHHFTVEVPVARGRFHFDVFRIDP